MVAWFAKLKFMLDTHIQRHAYGKKINYWERDVNYKLFFFSLSHERPHTEMKNWENWS